MSYVRQNKDHDSGSSESAGKAKAAAGQFSDQRESALAQLQQQQLMAAAPLQRMAVGEKEDELLQEKFVVQRQGLEDEEDILQGKFEPAQRAEKTNETGMPDNLKAGVESLSGLSMDHVRVHYNSDKPAQLNAHAYAQGSEIHLGPGQEKHLPHEAWHVVQQMEGRVRPTVQMKGGVGVNDDVGLEGEADLMGGRALNVKFSGSSTNMVSSQMKLQNGNISTASPVQLLPDIFSREAFANPGAYLENTFANSQINEDAGSGGIQDEPVRKLVLELAKTSRRAVFAERLIAAGGAGPRLSETLTNNVFDRETAHTWVIQNTLAISTLVPWALTIENVVMHEDAQGPVHTFHRDHGKVLLTDAALKARGVNSDSERIARRNVLNGPNHLGWVRGHYGVANKKHRFINHIHVDKDAPADMSFEIYDADSAAIGQTAEAFNLANRAGFTEGNNGRVDQAAIDVEGTAKRLSWEAYEGTLPAEIPEPVEEVEAD